MGVQRFGAGARDLWTAVATDRWLLRMTLLGLAVVSACGLVVAKLLDGVMGAEGTTDADRTITDWVVDHRTAALTAVARFVTHLGDAITVSVVAVVVSAALLATKHRHLSLLIAASTLGAALATAVAKYAVDRARPGASLWLSAATGPAFPSGHATQSIALYAALAVVGVRLTRWPVVQTTIIALAIGVALAVGGSRVYLGVHWTSDVVCGWAVAAAWLATLLLLGWSRPRVLSVWRNGHDRSVQSAGPIGGPTSSAP